MLKTYFKTTKSRRLEKTRRIREGVWINIGQAQENDLKKIVELTDLDILDVQDVLDLHELPRIERHKNSLIVYVRVPKYQSSQQEFVHTVPISIIITDRYFITISAFEDRIVKEVFKNDLPIATTQRGKLLVYLLLKMAGLFTHRIKEISNEVASKKKSIENIKDSDIGELIKHEDVLNQYISALIPMRNVFENIISGTYIDLYKDDQNLFDDMVIGIRQSVDICEVNLKSIKSLRESYQIVFTNRLNKVIQFLTAFTIIMTIPTIVASLYGMNVRLPFSENPLAFIYVLLISFVISALFLGVFYKKRWL